MKKPALRYLSRSDVEACGLGTLEVIDLVTAALAAKGKGQAEMPPKPGIYPLPNAFLHALPAYLPRMEVAGIKWIGGFPDNLERGLPYLTGLLVLNDAETGVPLAVMDCTWITVERNAAAAAIAARYLALPDADTLAIVGCGAIGWVYVAALGAVLPRLRTILAYDPDPANQEEMVAELDSVAGLRVVGTETAREAVAGAQVVVTPATMPGRTEPAIEAGWMQPGSFGCSVGLFNTWTPGALHTADKLCTDDTPQLLYYASEGYFHDLPLVHADLGEIIAEKRAGRQDERETIICINLGVAVADIAVAARVYQIALQKGLGHDLPL